MEMKRGKNKKRQSIVGTIEQMKQENENKNILLIKNEREIWNVQKKKNIIKVIQSCLLQHKQFRCAKFRCFFF